MSDLVFTVDVDASSGIAAINEFFNTVEKGSKAAGDKLRKALGDEDVEKKVIITLEGGKAVAKEVKTISSDTDKIVTAQKALNGQYGTTIQQVNTSLQLLKAMKQTTQKYSSDNKTITADWKMINTRIKEAQDTMKDLQSTSSSFGGRIQEIFGGMVGKITAANLASNALTATWTGLSKALNYLFQEGLQFEQLNLQLEAFTGSAAGAQAAMDSFLQTAIQTPLDVKQVAAAGKTLMAFGLDVDTAKDAVNDLAIVAGATGGQMDNLSRNLGQIAAQGRAFTRDLNQFAIQGIPIYSQLAEVMGTSVEEVRSLAEEGAVGFPEVQKALADMTKEGSAFAQIAESMNETFTGKIEEMVSSVQLLAGAITKGAMDLDKAFGSPVTTMMGAFSSALRGVADNMDAIIVVMKGLLTGLATMGVIIAGINLGPLLLGLATFAGSIVGMLAPMGAWIAAKITMLGLMGPAGWATLAAGVTAAGVAIIATTASMNNANKAALELGDSVESLTGEGMDPAKLTNWGQAMKDLIDKTDEQKEKVAALEDKLKAYQQVGADTSAVERELVQAKRAHIQAEIDIQRAYNNPYLDTRAGQIQKQIFALQQENEQLVKNGNAIDGVVTKSNKLKESYDAQKQKIKDLQDDVEEYFDSQIAGYEDTVDKIQEQVDAQKSAYKDATTAMEARHDRELDLIDNRNDAVIDSIQGEIDKLQEKGPAEQALEAYRLRELKQRRSMSGLSEKERLQLDAQIERKGRQQQIEAKQEQLAAARVKAEEERTAALKKQQGEMEAMKGLYEGQLSSLGDMLKEQKALIRAAKDEKKARLDALKAAVEGEDDRLRTLAEIDQAIDANIKLIKDTGRAWKDSTRAVKDQEAQIDRNIQKIERLKSLLASAQSQATRLANTPGPSSGSGRGSGSAAFSNFFTGGPMKGGQRAHVNEMGKEAFLSASGKLSMINAKPWDVWKAPSSGTVIPAHLTSQLNIPKGGVDLNKTPRSAGGGVKGGGPLSGVSSALRQLAASQQAGGTVNNQVTIQSSNTTQAASDMLVELSRLKRRR